MQANLFVAEQCRLSPGGKALRCCAGLANGVLLRTQVDRITGQLSDTRTRFLGTRPPKLFAANVKGQRSMLSLSSRPWLGYSDMGRYNLTPLSYEALDYASGLSLPLHICRLHVGYAQAGLRRAMPHSSWGEKSVSKHMHLTQLSIPPNVISTVLT